MLTIPCINFILIETNGTHRIPAIWSFIAADIICTMMAIKQPLLLRQDLLNEEETPCIRRENVEIEDLPDIHIQPLHLEPMEVKVIRFESLSRRYPFEDMDCYEKTTEKDCGNQIIKK